MLQVTIPAYEDEIYDPVSNEFSYPSIPNTAITLEHSLISLAKWEQKWHKSFLSSDNKTSEELLDYIRCMTISKGVDPMIYRYIPDEIFRDIINYIKDPMTATTFKKSGLRGAQKSANEVITAEIIYDWMISLSIPVEFEKWHLNTLLTLIRVRAIKTSPPEKVNPQEAARERARINAERKKRFNTTG